MKKALCIIFFFIALSSAYSQEDKLMNALYVEVIGNGGLYSLNYEYQFLNKSLARVGVCIYPEAVTVPIMIGQLIGQSKDFLELGIGVTPIFYSGGSEANSGKALFLTGTIGYRYQKPDGRFLFRIGFTPLINIYEPTSEDFDSFIPLGWISFGFRF